MAAPSTQPSDSAFELIRDALVNAWGEDQAITIDQLALRAGLSRFDTTGEGRVETIIERRRAERLLETRFSDFGFLVIASDRGYYRPTDPNQIEHWWASLHSRIKAIATRMHAGRTAACKDGYRYLGRGRFQKNRPKDDLFDIA